MSGKIDRTEPGARSRGEVPLTQETIKVGPPDPKKPPPLEVGFILDRRYEIQECVGEGGAGFVFRAFDRALGQQIALKVLHSEHATNKSWIKRLAREVKVAREIQHPNVCRVFELGHADGHWFITMEYAAGGTLRHVLDKRSGMFRLLKKDFSPTTFAAKFDDARAVCAGLAAIHAVGIVHRDVTPGNVLRMDDGRLVITDFGLAIKDNDKTTFHGGTPKYMAPEVLARKPADQRSDVWQLGILLHEIIFLKHPEWTHVGERVLLQAPTDFHSTPAECAIAELCTECLSHNPAARPANAVAVAGRLAAAEYAQPPGLLVVLWQKLKRTARRRAVWVSLAFALLVATGFGLRDLWMRPFRCGVAVARADFVWGDDRQHRVQSKFLEHVRTRPHAADTFRFVAAAIKQHLADWKAAYRPECNSVSATQAQTNPALMCLEDDLDGVRALAHMFEHGEGGARLIDRAPHTVASLRDVIRCKTASMTSAQPRPPAGKLRDHVDQIRRELMFANPLTEGESYAAAVNLVEPLVQAAQRTGYCPLVAEALLAQAHAIGSAGNDPTYRSRLEDALWKAEACGHDRVVAIAAGELAFADRFKPDNVSASWSRMADSVLERIGGDVRIQSWIENNRATAAGAHGRHAEAIQSYDRALRLKLSEVGPVHLEVGLRFLNLSDALKVAGRLKDALDASDRTLVILSRWLGPDHVDVGMAKSNRGDLFLALQRVGEAKAAYQEAIAIFRATLSTNDPRMPYPLAGLGMALLEEGNANEARVALEEAEGMNAVDSDPVLRSEVKFALARALAGTGADFGRVLALARAAAEGYGEAETLRPRREEISKWITAHDRAPSRNVGGRAR